MMNQHGDVMETRCIFYYPAVYQGNDIGGCKRDISGGREFSYVSATEYTMQVFDRVNDSRFWKSFITCYGANETKKCPHLDSRRYAIRSGRCKRR